MKKELKVEVGSVVAFNMLDDAAWFDVLEVRGDVLTLREHGSNFAKQTMYKSLVKQVKTPSEPKAVPAPKADDPPAPKPGPEMTAEQVADWLAEMKEKGLARSDSACGRLLGFSANSVAHIKKYGTDRRTALACAALLHQLAPYPYVECNGTEIA